MKIIDHDFVLQVFISVINRLNESDIRFDSILFNNIHLQIQRSHLSFSFAQTSAQAKSTSLKPVCLVGRVVRRSVVVRVGAWISMVPSRD